MRHAMTAAGTALLLGCAPTPSDLADERALAEARPIGEPIDCLLTTEIRDTQVRDEATIDFNLRNGQVYRNRLPDSCPGLGFNGAFSYRPAISRLCSIDTITVLNSGGVPGPTCGLGSFQRVEAGAP